MNLIESKQNEKILLIKKLQKDRSYRSKTGLIWIEGIHLIQEATRSNCKFHSFYLTDKVSKSLELEVLLKELASGPALANVISEKVEREVFETQSPQGIGALIYKPIFSELSKDKPVLIIDEVQDPGNLGTLIRSAEASGIENIILLKGTVDVWSGKVLRSTMGSIFRMNILEGCSIDILDFLHTQGYQLIGTTLKDASSYKELEVTTKSALILGNEGRGIRTEILEKLDIKTYIPMTGLVESLNVGVAGSILMFYFYGKDC